MILLYLEIRIFTSLTTTRILGLAFKYLQT